MMYRSLTDKNSKAFLAALVILTMAGAVLLLYSTQLAPWSIEDSIDYIDTANNLVAGHGLVNTRPSGRFEPIHLHPPFYSIALAPAAFLKLDMIQAARWMNVFFFAASIFILGFGSWYLTGSRRFGLLGALLFAASTAMLNSFSGIMSEGLYYLLTIIGLLLIVKHLQRPAAWAVITAGFVGGAILLTRYNGVAFLGVGAAALLLTGQRQLKQRLIDAAVFSVPGVLPFFLWNAYLRTAFPNVKPGYYDWQVSNLWEAFAPVRGALADAAWTWLGLNFLWDDPPYRYEVLILAVLLLLVVLSAAYAVWRYRIEKGSGLLDEPGVQIGLLWLGLALASTFVLTYSFIFVVFPKPALYERILAPIQIGLLLAALAWAEFIASTVRGKRLLQVVPLVLGLILVGSNLPSTLTAAQDLHQNGLGYTSRTWLNSPILEEVRKLHPDIPLISNQPAPIFFLAGRPTYDMISSLDQAGLNPLGVRYGDHLGDSNQKLFREDGAALVIFELGIWDQLYNMNGISGSITLQELTQGLFEYARVPDGRIYFYSPQPAANRP